MIDFKIVEVEWEDARTELDAAGADEIKECGGRYSKTVGFLVEKTKKHIKLAGLFFPETKDDFPIFKYIHIIPRSLIRKMRVLK